MCFVGQALLSEPSTDVWFVLLVIGAKDPPCASESQVVQEGGKSSGIGVI